MPASPPLPQSSSRLHAPGPSCSRRGRPVRARVRGLRERCDHSAASSRSPPSTCTQSPSLEVPAAIPDSHRVALVLNCAADLCRDFRHGHIAIDPDQPLLVPVIIGYGFGLKLIRGKPLANDFFAIIVPHHQLETINVTDFINAGWLKVDVVDVSSGTGTTSGQPA